MSNDCFSSYFLIAVLIVFFMLLYVYVGPNIPSSNQIRTDTFKQQFFNGGLARKEQFKDNELIPMDKIVFIQGNGVPDKQPDKIIFDQSDPSAQSVDGTDSAPVSMFPFAFNKCDVKCCGDAANLSCNGGCVCLTNEQKRFMSNRGYNNKFDKCSYDGY